MLDNETTVHGRVMRLPTFDGMIPTSGPMHIVSDDGEEYLLITGPTNAPGPVETLALICEPIFLQYLNKDISVKGDVLGSIIWNVKVIN